MSQHDGYGEGNRFGECSWWRGFFLTLAVSTLFDNAQRYQIDFPAGWKKR